jgi:SNF2 family DNA or RNA helicase
LVKRLVDDAYRAVLLCDEMGLGKTIQTLLAAARLDARRILIACPAGARPVWVLEIGRWLPAWSHRVFVVDQALGVQASLERLAADNAIVVVSFDVLSAINGTWPTTLARAWDLLVIDEAHFLKNPSNRTVALYGRGGTRGGIQAHARRVILLSGTPAPNNAAELWQHCRTFWPELIRWQQRDLTQAEFEEHVSEWRDTRFGRQIVHSKNQPWLRDCLRPVVLRRAKAKVLPELPALVTQDVPLSVPDLMRRLEPVQRSTPPPSGSRNALPVAHARSWCSAGISRCSSISIAGSQRMTR